jgi:type VI secretion system protein ImpF
MSKNSNLERFVPPVMLAFRAAFASRDAGLAMDGRDVDGERVIAGRRTTPRNSVGEGVLKEQLVTDLQALLNTVSLESTCDLEGFDEIKTSILNFGVDDLTAISSGSRAATQLDEKLKEVVATYETRLSASSLRVHRKKDGEFDTRLAFHFAGEMHASPHDLPVEFVADVEAYSGKISLKNG